MSLRKSKFWYSNNFLHFSKHAVPLYLSIYLRLVQLFLSACLSVCASFSMSVCLSVYLYVCPSVHLPFSHSAYLSVCPSVYISASQLLYLSINLSVWLSVYVFVFNGTACFEKCKKLLEYQNLLLLSDIWWLKF